MVDSGNPYPKSFKRSPESREFEALWRSLRAPSRLVPGRAEFQPSKARRFLRDLVLMEAPSAVCSTLRIRLTGRRFVETIGFDISGRDHLEFMAPEFHAGVLATARAMIDRPCGLWQVTPAHLVRGYALNFEITAFPLAPDEQGRAFIISHLLPVGDVMSSTLPTDRGLGLGTALTYAFLDIGAGEPAQTAHAA
jgi:hypothetical protein